MLDNLERLRNCIGLKALLAHYGQLGETNPEMWQPRLAQMDGEERTNLVKLHGELIASDFIEQNTGQMPCSYRLTRVGLRAFKQILNLGDDELGSEE